MSDNVHIQRYFDSVNAPWGKLYYQLVWHNIECENKKILDYGSGFGLTSNHLAEKNDVTAIEPNEEMLAHRLSKNEYCQLSGGLEQLKGLPERTFDMIICHNVIEYMENRDELFHEFDRVLKPNGIVSIVKHNRTGKIMQKAVFEYNVEEAMQLLKHNNLVSANFGTINEYEDWELETYGEAAFRIDKTYGVRTFFALQRNEIKTEPEWLTNMFQLECAAEEVPELRNIAFFHHVILKRI